jgi:biopolymer transport protein ExbD
MSMSIGLQDDQAVCEMNTTPLIDVMLVLLIMFILNVPLQTHATKLVLPSGGASSISQTHRLSIDFAGNVSWDGAMIDTGALDAKFQSIGRIKNIYAQPEIHFRPDKYAKYDVVLNIMAMAQKRHVQKISFVGSEDYRI